MTHNMLSAILHDILHGHSTEESIAHSLAQDDPIL